MRSAVVSATADFLYAVVGTEKGRNGERSERSLLTGEMDMKLRFVRPEVCRQHPFRFPLHYQGKEISRFHLAMDSLALGYVIPAIKGSWGTYTRQPILMPSVPDNAAIEIISFSMAALLYTDGFKIGLSETQFLIQLEQNLLIVERELITNT